MRRAFVVAALAVGCGGSKAPPAAPVLQLPPATIVGATTQRAPSKEIAVRFPYAANEEVTSLAYSDLANRGFVAAVASSFAAWAGETAGVDRACVDAIASGAK